MAAMRPSLSADVEQVIGALVPGPQPLPTPAAAPVPMLPARRWPIEPVALPLLDIACVDRSGRVSARDLLRQLHWTAGHAVDIDVVAGVLVAASSAGGAYIVGSRGDLALPAAARALCGVTDTVVLAAYPSHDLVVIYRSTFVAQLLHEHHRAVVVADAY
jgi:hypothetical protein